MSRPYQTSSEPDRIEQMMANVQIPLENIEFTIEQYLLENGSRLDTETRVLLARVRDSVGRVAVSTRRLSTEEMREAADTRAALWRYSAA